MYQAMCVRVLTGIALADESTRPAGGKNVKMSKTPPLLTELASQMRNTRRILGEKKRPPHKSMTGEFLLTDKVKAE
jgi:hypothetical protein